MRTLFAEAGNDHQSAALAPKHNISHQTFLDSLILIHSQVALYLPPARFSMQPDLSHVERDQELKRKELYEAAGYDAKVDDSDTAGARCDVLCCAFHASAFQE